MTDADGLRRRGVVLAFLQLKSRGHTATRKLLFALEAACRGIHWNQLSADDKARLLQELAEHPRSSLRRRTPISPAIWPRRWTWPLRPRHWMRFRWAPSWFATVKS